MSISSDLEALIERVRKLEKWERESPSAAAYEVLVAAELVWMDGYQPGQKSLNKLRQAVEHYRQTVLPKECGK